MSDKVKSRDAGCIWFFVNDLLEKNSVHFDNLGVIEDKNLSFNGEMNLPIEELTKTHKYWLRNYMEN